LCQFPLRIACDDQVVRARHAKFVSKRHGSDALRTITRPGKGYHEQWNITIQMVTRVGDKICRRNGLNWKIHTAPKYCRKRFSDECACARSCQHDPASRSEERRVGKASVARCRAR